MNDDNWEVDPISLEGQVAEEAADQAAAEAVESDFELLCRQIDADPGSAAFPRLAEAYRRDGQIERAEEIAKNGLARAPERLGGKVALALAMLDKGDITLASHELQAILENVPEVPHEATEDGQYAAPLASPSEALPRFDSDQVAQAEADQDLRPDEIDHAFEQAETDPDPLASPNDLAEAAVLGADDASDAVANYRVSEHPLFATRTMAQLLEGQGDVAGAESIREAMGGPEGETEEVQAAMAAERTPPDSPAAGPVPDLAALAARMAATTAPVLPSPNETTNDPYAVTVPEPQLPETAAVATEPDRETVQVDAAPAEPQSEPLDAAEEIAHLAATARSDASAAVSNREAERSARRQRIIARLEGWLENLRRDSA